MDNRIDRERGSSRHRRRSRSGVAEPQANLPEADVKPAAQRSPLWLVLLLCLAGSSVVSFIVFKLLIVPSMPPELMGTWEVTGGPLRGATLDFRQDGTA